MANGLIRAALDELDSVNLADPRAFADYDLTDYWRMLRTTQPVYWHPAIGNNPGFWVLSRPTRFEPATP
jgi:hypothetical protein